MKSNKSKQSAVKTAKKKKTNNKAKAKVDIGEIVIKGNPTPFKTKGTHRTTIPIAISDRARMKADYLRFMLNPRLSLVSEPPRLPSTIKVPTAVIHIVDQHKFSVNNKGNALITWRPNFLSTANRVQAANDKIKPGWDQYFAATAQNTKYYWSNLTINTDNSLDGVNATQGHNDFVACVNLDLPATRYRMTGAELRITYMGPSDQISGMYQGCVSYNDTVVSSGKWDYEYIISPAPAGNDPAVDEFTVFSKIQNGLWASTQPITNAIRGVRTIFIPTDLSDKEFKYIGEYYDPESNELLRSDNQRYSRVMQRTEQGAQMTHVIAISDAQPGAKFNLEIVANYEVVADTSSANILGVGAVANLEDRFNNSYADMMQNAFNDAASEANVINRPVVQPVPEPPLNNSAEIPYNQNLFESYVNRPPAHQRRPNNNNSVGPWRPNRWDWIFGNY